MEKQQIYHAIKVDTNVCYGCTHCMHVCPTDAIRITNGKAHVLNKKCVDCGECLKSCPVGAIYVEQDDLETMFQYKYRVAIVPAVLTGQFPTSVSEEEIFSEMYHIGFTHVYQAEYMVEVINELLNEMIPENEDKPLLSTFCPAVVRLIQVKFPALKEHIARILPPVDASALYYRKMLVEQGIPEHEIGIFYVTPCAAKIAAIKSRQDKSHANINGVINMSYLYNRIYKAIKNRSTEDKELPVLPHLSAKAVKWSLARGEVDNINGVSLAVDEIHNVIDFLELLENEEIPKVDFLELRACDQGCAGGALLKGNRFLTVERIKMRAKQLENDQQEDVGGWEAHKDVLKDKDYMFTSLSPMPAQALDQDFNAALKKMERVRDLMCYLPGIDCGACGSPSCQTLAEDIVQNAANLSDCVFLQRMMEKKKKLHSDHAIRIIEKTWGKDRLDKDCKKRGAKNESL